MRIRARTLLLTLALLASPLTQAAVTKCYAIGAGSWSETLSVQWLAFDPVKGAAQMEFGKKHHSGRITHIRDHDTKRKRYNLVFPSPFTFHKADDEMEIMLFPISDEYWRIGGVVTVVTDGRRNIELLVPAQDFSCQTFDAPLPAS